MTPQEFFYVGPPNEDIFSGTPSKSCISVIITITNFLWDLWRWIILPVLWLVGTSWYFCSVLNPHTGLSDILSNLSIMLSGPTSWSPCFCGDSQWMVWDFRSDTLWESCSCISSVGSSRLGIMAHKNFKIFWTHLPLYAAIILTSNWWTNICK